MIECDFKQLVFDQRRKIAQITLNRPDVLNAMSLELYTELADAIELASACRDVQVIVITGTGRAFSTGGDLRQGDVINRLEPNLFAQASSRVFKSLLASEKTIIAKVNGIAQASGVLIVAACDLAIASDQATFRCPEALVGLWEPYGPKLLPLAIGVKRAKYLLLTCDKISAVEAERMGLINCVVPHAELDRVTDELIEKVLAGGPMARAQFKRMINEQIGDFDPTVVLDALCSDEGREGMAAFVEKRKPRWRE
ncbi:MAG: enoyl-CoA hydratase/isomerase family protein [Acidobacteriota bacterium]|nr:enoyl-CoA hydratase/isomerase family protein [Blastocatellia bacterium]MDW8240907.1 enoyl-CoA hydratase/isomerase family protein [Acidobacteriota bacterium]